MHKVIIILLSYFSLTFCNYASAMAAQDMVQNITSSSGIYFDYLGKLKIINGHLNVLTPIDISHIQPHIENINSILGTIRFMCRQTNNLECHNMLEPLTARYHDINNQFSSITHLIDNRIKRSWFGGIGTVFKHIFGVLDENDAYKYDNAINTVQNNNQKLASLIKENILVTTSTISMYNDTIHKLKLNEDSLTEAIDKLTIKFKNLTIITNNLVTSLEINSILNSLETSILSVSFQLEDIINAILFSNSNILHPSIITPYQLYQELASNYRHIPNNLELALSLDIKSIHSILNVSTLICYYLNNKIVFVLKIPLVTSQEFYLYHNIPLPVPHYVERPDSFSVILPEKKYTAITKDKTHYANLDSLEGCKNANVFEYICKIMNIYPLSAHPSCESEILSKVLTTTPLQCKTEFLHGQLDVWKPLMNNRWIFVQSKPTKLSVDCINSEVIERNIVGTGIVTIPVHCTAYCRSTKLYTSDNVFNITSPSTSYSNFNLINDSCCNYDKFKETVDNAPPINIQNIDLENIKFKQNAFNKPLLRKLDEIINQPHIIKYGAHYSVLSIILVLIIISIIIFKLYSKLYKSERHSKILNIFKRTSNKDPSETNQLPVINTIEQNDVDIETVAPKIRTRV